MTIIHEQSYGIIPLRQREGKWETLLIQHQAGHWAFPKGHPEPGESAKQAAERELKEETGLDLSYYLKEEPLIESYFFSLRHQKIHKTVSYFLAVVEGFVSIQEAEVNDSQWIELDQAEHVITFKEAKRLCQEAQHFLSSLN